MHNVTHTSAAKSLNKKKNTALVRNFPSLLYTRNFAPSKFLFVKNTNKNFRKFYATLFMDLRFTALSFSTKHVLEYSEHTALRVVLDSSPLDVSGREKTSKDSGEKNVKILAFIGVLTTTTTTLTRGIKIIRFFYSIE